MQQQIEQTTDFSKLFSPIASDIEYLQEELFKIALIFRTDSYKFSHPFAYPDDIEIQAMTSYGEARVSPEKAIYPFGMQILVKRFFTQKITMADVDAAEQFAIAHFGRKLFARAAWEKVVNVYDGYLPIIIRCVKEGTKIKGGDPIYTVTCLDKDLFWMSAGFETMIQRGVWYPTTIMSEDMERREIFKHYYEMSGADISMMAFALHDFGGRGVTCGEQAEIGGAAHVASGFMGSDTIEGILTANALYKEDMAAYSVFATEHSIQCSFGGGTEDAKRYIRRVLKNALPGTIVSIVIDGYDVYREAGLLCTEFKDDIINSGAKVVFRPDSGDMMVVVPKLLKMQADAFGYTLNAKGYKKINYVGLIQGDGVDTLAIRTLLGNIVVGLGYTADCVLFGSGGALLQKVNRDTLKFAQKASAILVNGKWIGIAKDPVTDSGKKSKEGVLTLIRNKETNEYSAFRLDLGEIPDGFEDAMQLVYYKGKLFNETTLAEVRNRANQ